MIVTLELKSALEAKGWKDKGICSCSVPMREFAKGNFVIKISPTRNLWNIVTKFGNLNASGTDSETLIASIQSI